MEVAGDVSAVVGEVDRPVVEPDGALAEAGSTVVAVVGHTDVVEVAGGAAVVAEPGSVVRVAAEEPVDSTVVVVGELHTVSAGMVKSNGHSDSPGAGAGSPAVDMS